MWKVIHYSSIGGPKEDSLYVILHYVSIYLFFFKNVKFGVKGECDLYCLEIRSVLNSPTKGNTKQP